MNKINSTIVGRQSSMDDIRGYFNRVYNQMKEDPEGRYPANFEDFWRLFFDRRENAILFLRDRCKQDKDYLALHETGTDAEKDYLVTFLVLGMFVKELRHDLIPLFNDVFLQENEKSLKQLRDITKRHKELIRKYDKLKSKSQKRHEQDIATIEELEEAIKSLEDTITKRDDTIAVLLAKFETGKACPASNGHPHIVSIGRLKSFFIR